MQRIEQNADVVGSDEQFFDGDPVNIHDLYSDDEMCEPSVICSLGIV